MTSMLLSDEQWARIAARLVGRRGKIGRPRADDRRCLEAVLHVLATGGGWQDLPAHAASRMTAWRRLRNWQETGAWPRIWQAYLDTLDVAGRRLWSRALLQGAFVPAHKGERRWAPPSRRSRSDSEPAAARSGKLGLEAAQRCARNPEPELHGTNPTLTRRSPQR